MIFSLRVMWRLMFYISASIILKREMINMLRIALTRLKYTWGRDSSFSVCLTDLWTEKIITFRP